jgi:integrase/recombinase XerD
VKRPKSTARTPTPYVDGADAHRLLTYADERDPRAALLVRLLLVYGLRVSEAVALDVTDEITDAGGCALRVHGKGDTYDVVPLDQPTCDVLDAWLAERAARGADPAAGPLLIDRYGARLTRQAAASVIDKVSRAALGAPLTPHSLRKSTAVALYRNGASHEQLRRWGRWEALSTVGHYVATADDEDHPGLLVADVFADAARRRGDVRPSRRGSRNGSHS